MHVVIPLLTSSELISNSFLTSAGGAPAPRTPPTTTHPTAARAVTHLGDLLEGARLADAVVHALNANPRNTVREVFLMPTD